MQILITASLGANFTGSSEKKRVCTKIEQIVFLLRYD